MTKALLPDTRLSMDAIIREVAHEADVPIEAIHRHGKLTQHLMETRRKAIRKMHATGRYRRSEIALYFGLSVYTITSSLEDAMKDRPVAFSSSEDHMIVSMHCSGQPIELIVKALPGRTISAIRRRITTLRKTDQLFRPFPRPSYQGGPSAMIEAAKRENTLMLRNI